MKKFLTLFTSISLIITLVSCQAITKKIDEKTVKEEKELSKWLGQTEAELKSFFGRPDKIEFNNNRSRYYIYLTKKLKIQCERKFEINSNNIVLGFSSKNCF
tara:strand:+ start:240 stop:545 length:306 start_codon:yes stop_codon:yes gene_type:complete